MFKKIGIILFFLASVEARHAVPLHAQTQQTECPPECTIDTMEIVTWYPSPYNEYEELRLYPKFSADESDCNSGDKLGLMYYNKDEQALKVCWQSPDTLAYSWEKIGSEQSGLLRLGNYATGSRPGCSNAILGALVYDTTEKRPYVCALNASNNPVWKPLDSDYDRDGVTDAVDANDNDFNDATAVEANVETGKTFYARGGSRRTGTLVASDIGGICRDDGLFRDGTYNDCNGVFYPGGYAYYCVNTYGSAAYCNPRPGCWMPGTSCACISGYTLFPWQNTSMGSGNPTVNIYYCKKN